MKRLINCIIICSFIFYSCKENKERIAAQRIVTEWKGKAVQFPEYIQCSILGKDTVSNICSDLFQKEYKILFYTDSTGCSSCRLKLFQWKQLIKEADDLSLGKIGFIFFFQPKNKMEMEFIFRIDQFDYPVFIDENNTINRLNHFPDDSAYQCYLLDRDNKIVIIGNPVLNPKIWDMYKYQVFGNKLNTPQN
jgi:hypothetical protein